MDTDAQRRARQHSIKQNLADAYTDEEASPPEWVDLQSRIRRDAQTLKESVATETDAFAGEPDIRRALARRERFAERFREDVAKHNATVDRLNVLAPHARFRRGRLNADEMLRPLFRTERKR